ncbi:hypothetical protein VARIO8X_150147 [Burkholderiales bacterium 8X]|nr:hypothetical protein VARIO8X_150147 [Burkholderiales bacterium 8X]
MLSGLRLSRRAIFAMRGIGLTPLRFLLCDNGAIFALEFTRKSDELPQFGAP